MLSGRTKKVTRQLTLTSALLLPLLAAGLALLFSSPGRSTRLRLLATFAAILVVGGVVFLRQFLLDRKLIRLLDESRESVESLQRAQAQLVQREKLASLGQLVAGAAPELRAPLTTILQHSELLASSCSLEPEQSQLARKLGQQAQRTYDLISGLLGFAQQLPADQSLVDMSLLLHRAAQMELVRMGNKNIRLETHIPGDLPRIWGNANQLFHCCYQIILNALDAMEGVDAGVLSITAWPDASEVVLEFRDSGPGIQNPQRVFDPFYTTKPVGKGTGLGLSSTYGLVQNHHGHIACHNLPEGGAVFVLRFPVGAEAETGKAQSAEA
jgi:signal transduction histidine kinase